MPFKVGDMVRVRPDIRHAKNYTCPFTLKKDFVCNEEMIPYRGHLATIKHAFKTQRWHYSIRFVGETYDNEWTWTDEMLMNPLDPKTTKNAEAIHLLNQEY